MLRIRIVDQQRHPLSEPFSREVCIWGGKALRMFLRIEVACVAVR